METASARATVVPVRGRSFVTIPPLAGELAADSTVRSYLPYPEIRPGISKDPPGHLSSGCPTFACFTTDPGRNAPWGRDPDDRKVGRRARQAVEPLAAGGSSGSAYGYTSNPTVRKTSFTRLESMSGLPSNLSNEEM